MAGFADVCGKHVVLTGASGGIGAIVARTLAMSGAHLTLADLHEDAMSDVLANCTSAGAQAVAVGCDVTSASDRVRMLEHAHTAHGPIDVLVNVAGIAAQAPFALVSPAQISAIISVNLDAPIQLTKLVLPEMVERRRGAIVQMGSLAGKLSMPYNQIYGATKAGLINYTRAMRHELAGTGVHMGVVCPGLVKDAGMWAELDERVPSVIGEVSPERVAKAVLKVIRGSGEELVTAGPVRPIIAAGELSPRLGAVLMRRIGFVKLLREAAIRHNQGAGRREV